jgi:antibiotic biosynthesis monooxygenase (ABM) superfamily enzyme
MSTEPTAGLRLTTLDPGDSSVTIINTYLVAPDRAEALLDYLLRATDEIIRHVPGFVSANLHVSLDRTRVVNYAQWQSGEAIATARDYPGVMERMGEAGLIADSFMPIQYQLRHSVAAS